MVVIIDPELKKLFFDRIMEQCGFNAYEASKWIEAVAYGDKSVIMDEKHMTTLSQNMEKLEKEKEQYRRLWIDQSAASKRYSERLRKYRNVDNEIGSYLEEIEEYRAIITHAGLQEYLDE